MTTGRVVIEDILALSSRLPWDALADLERRLAGAPRVYCYAVGRCGLVVRMFAMRLMHLGYVCHVVGEVTTPAIAPRDLLLVASGSGRTPTVHAVVDQARAAGATVVLLTASSDSPLLERADLVIPIPGASKLDLAPSRQPPGSPFEQMLFCFLEEAVCFLMGNRGVGAPALMARHANVE